ncbi:fungal-specific transcription factor domain-containing protein [Aspergillus spectabilis]
MSPTESPGRGVEIIDNSRTPGPQGDVRDNAEHRPIHYGEAESTMGIAQKIFGLGRGLIDEQATSAIPGYQASTSVANRRTAALGQRFPIASLLGQPLPSAEVMYALLEDYFGAVHWFSLVIYEPTFRKNLHSISDGFAYSSQKHFLILLAVVLGIGAWYRSQRRKIDLSDDLDWRQMSAELLKLVESHIVELMDRPSVTAAQICILFGSYCVYHGRPNLSFSLLGATIKISQAAGLHREPSRGTFEDHEERKRITGDAMVGVTFVRNAVSTAFIFALDPWFESIGIQNVILSMTLIATFILSFAVVFLIWGRDLRVFTAVRYRRIARLTEDEVKRICWTCRRRKVKCWLEKPACTRCIKGKHHCEGYGLLLHWIDNNPSSENDMLPNIRGNAVKRKAMLTPRFASWDLDMDRVTELLKEIEQIARTRDRLIGPFTIFPITNNSLDSSSAAEFGQLSHATAFDTLSELSSSPSSPPSPLDGSLCPRILPLDLSAKSRSPSALYLFQHYTTYVAQLLQPVLSTRNFYNTVYVPQALVGAWDLFKPLSSSNESSGNRSIFFSILATSAFHIRGNQHACTSMATLHELKMDTIGKRCRVMAYRHLRAVFAEGFHSQGAVEATMSAILSFITIDVMHGSMSEFLLHLSAFRALQSQYQNRNRAGSAIERYLSTVFYFQSTLSKSTDCNFTPTPWPSDTYRASRREQLLYRTPPIDEICLQQTYGITRQLTIFIQAITTLLQSLQYYFLHHTTIPATLHQAIETLTTHLTKWAPSPVLLPSTPTPETLLDLHTLAFHHSIQILHITHLLTPLSRSRHELLPTQFQLQLQIHTHTTTVLKTLMAIETLKISNSTLSKTPTAPILWQDLSRPVKLLLRTGIVGDSGGRLCWGIGLEM